MLAAHVNDSNGGMRCDAIIFDAMRSYAIICDLTQCNAIRCYSSPVWFAMAKMDHNARRILMRLAIRIDWLTD